MSLPYLVLIHALGRYTEFVEAAREEVASLAATMGDPMDESTGDLMILIIPG